MKKFPLSGRSLTLALILVPLLIVFIYVGLRSGPLAPVDVVIKRIESQALHPALFGIGTIESRFTHKIGPTSAGRVQSISVDVGDEVKAGQVLGQIDPIDLVERMQAQDAAVKRAQASLIEAQAKSEFAQKQATRYEELFKVKSTSEEILSTKRQELRLALAALGVAKGELGRVQAERQALEAQFNNLKLISPIDGIVILRAADAGSTIVAGQSVIEVIDLKNLWVNVRFDQINATGLGAGQPAQIELRSSRGKVLAGQVQRVEPLADSVTEETLAKISFDTLPVPPPPIGELAEVTVKLASEQTMPVIPNAAIRRDGEQIMVWRSNEGKLEKAPIKIGLSDLNGQVQVLKGLEVGDEIVVYSASSINANTNIRVVDQIKGSRP
jgi:RND family efflux transporter MFP subunit